MSMMLGEVHLFVGLPILAPDFVVFYSILRGRYVGRFGRTDSAGISLNFNM